MDGKNKEVRIAIIVLVVLFAIILLASLWTSQTTIAVLEAGGEGGVSLVDNDTVHEASYGHLVLPPSTANSVGRQALNNKLLAAEAYRSAAESGDPEAQFKLGEAYSNGRVVPSDQLAIAWYRQSAAQGFAPAQNRLGLIYQHVGNNSRYLVVAYALYRLAASHAVTPSADAKKNMDELKKTMSERQIEDGDILADKLSDLDEFLQTLDQSAR